MRLAAGRFAFAVRLGFCFGATMMIGGRVVADGAAVDGAVVQGDGSVLCAHTLQGNSNKATIMLCAPEIETRAFMIWSRMLASGVTGTVAGDVPRRRLGQELTSVRGHAAFARPWDPGARSRALPRWSYRAILNA